MSNTKVVICVMQNVIPFACVKQNHTEKSLALIISSVDVVLYV